MPHVDDVTTESIADSSGQSPRLEPVIISAPFGNYIQPEGTTPTLGTFTLYRRPGRLWRILKTVRYRPTQKAWVNRIGLRNPGIDWLINRVQRGRCNVADKIISVHGFDDDQWYALLEKITVVHPLAIELNMSCPNVGEIGWPSDLFERAVGTGIPVIVKLPPIRYEQMMDQAIDAGVRCFHCCNTLPVPEGGMSGKPLQPVSLGVIRDLRGRSCGQDLTLIGGGGIYELEDIDRYLEAGADHVALGTKTMNPVYLLTHAGLRPMIRYAHQRLSCR